MEVKRRLERHLRTWRRPPTWTWPTTSNPASSDHRERQEKPGGHGGGADARVHALPAQRAVLDDVETITAYALDLSVFLNESELTERRAFIESFVKEIVVMPDNAVVRYTILNFSIDTKGSGTRGRWI